MAFCPLLFLPALPDFSGMAGKKNFAPSVSGPPANLDEFFGGGWSPVPHSCCVVPLHVSQRGPKSPLGLLGPLKGRPSCFSQRCEVSHERCRHPVGATTGRPAFAEPVSGPAWRCWKPDWHRRSSR